jgi:prepilin-type N-terminal cleavage/methylation domain-containing protein
VRVMNTIFHRMDTRGGRGFSLIELVIVVVIIGIIGAIAVPRMSRGAKGAADAALSGDLRVLRDALDLFAIEHSGLYPEGSDIEASLLEYSGVRIDDLNPTKTTTQYFGPYLRSIPKLPVGANKGKATFSGIVPGATANNSGWYYNQTTGQVLANCADAEVDVSGKPYNTY